MYFVTARSGGKIYIAYLTGYQECMARNWQLKDDSNPECNLENVPTISFSTNPMVMSTASSWYMSNIRLAKVERDLNPDFPQAQYDRIQRMSIKLNPVYNLQRYLADGTPQIRIYRVLRDVQDTLMVNCTLVMGAGAYEHNPPVCQWTQTPRASQTPAASSTPKDSVFNSDEDEQM